MRRLVATLALFALALPAQAVEDALVLEVGTHELGYPTIENRTEIGQSTWNTGPIHWEIVGHYLWLEWGTEDREADSDSEHYVSVDISDPTITQVVAYRDGTVDIIRKEPAPPPGPVETVDAVEEFPQIEWDTLLPAGVRPE